MGWAALFWSLWRNLQGATVRDDEMIIDTLTDKEASQALFEFMIICLFAPLLLGSALADKNLRIKIKEIPRTATMVLAVHVLGWFFFLY
ncbi:MAG TPA: hypothetical protein PLW48_04560 [Alphaproteobacteria bacterium]|nr:hypothetical protein [Rhodospirillaceae bacterium]HRJ66388.1 hypothetical protein [Alphaproteobacteria bacterium]